MPNYNYKSGYRLERKIVKSARDSGLLAYRSAGSHSKVDVTIFAPKEPVLIQCKSMKGELKNKFPNHLKKEASEFFNLADEFEYKVKLLYAVEYRTGNKNEIVYYSKGDTK